MRTVFFGTPELAVPSLAAIAERHEVAAVVCRPDKPQKRSKKPVPPPVKVWAEAHGIAVNQPTKLNDGTFEAWLKEQGPEICVTSAYGRLLKQPILDVPKRGYINMHPSLLPRHRGPSPIQTAIMMGDEVTGVTIMRVVLAMDAGDILLQEEVPILPEDTSATLGERLGVLGGQLLARAMDLVEADEAASTPQDASKVTVCKLFEKAHGQIRWASPAREIHNLVRAAVPWPVAHCAYKGETCRIHKTELVEGASSGEPGTVTAVEKDRVAVATGEGSLAILVFQAPGKRAIPMADFLRGHPVEVGERFEDL